jgi:hypothetical protein
VLHQHQADDGQRGNDLYDHHQIEQHVHYYSNSRFNYVCKFFSSNNMLRPRE